MGIYDRDYYRGGRNTFLDSLSRTGQVCKWLILINVGVYLLQVITLPPPGLNFAALDYGFVTDTLKMDVAKVMEGQVWRLLTYAFLHDPTSLWHLLFNMLFLWWFGSELESIYGPREFLSFYLIGALAGGVAYVLHPGLQDWFAGGTARCLGASGAVTAVMVVYAFHFPTRVIYLFFFLPVPIWAFVALQIFQDAIGLVGGSAGHVAITSHLGGALFGFLYYRFGWRIAPLWRNLMLSVRNRTRPRLRVYHGEEQARTPVASAVRSSVDEQFEAKLDAVLEKIKVVGQNNLTEEERLILKRASEIYKQRRSTREDY